MTPLFMTEREEKLKSFLMKVKEESEKAGLKLNIQKQRSWHLVTSLHGKQMGKKMETVTDFIFLGSKITVDSDCNQEIKRHLILGRKAMMHLDSVLKSKDTTLLTKVHIVKATVFQVVMYSCENWTIKKAEPQRTEAFKLVLETFDSPLNSKEIRLVNLTGNQP